MNQMNQNCNAYGQYIPSQGDIIYLGNDGFGFVDNVILDGSSCVVNFYATVYDYTYEGGSMEIKQPDGMYMSISDLKKASEAQLAEFREHLDAMNLSFDNGYKKVINKPISRVVAGSEYYYIDTDMAERSAIDDGADSGIHYARFQQGNYFKNIRRAALLGKEIRVLLKSFVMPNGNWT